MIGYAPALRGGRPTTHPASSGCPHSPESPPLLLASLIALVVPSLSWTPPQIASLATLLTMSNGRYELPLMADSRLALALTCHPPSLSFVSAGVSLPSAKPVGASVVSRFNSSAAFIQSDILSSRSSQSWWHLCSARRSGHRSSLGLVSYSP
eukprot:scaffold33427_cov18-Prasinocladus_malaysianus.AAC.2